MTFSLADSRRTTGFYVAEGWQRFSRRLALGRISAVRFAGTVPNRLIVAPIDLRVAEVPAPRPGDRIEIDSDAFLIQGEPVRDRERLVWTVDLRPA